MKTARVVGILGTVAFLLGNGAFAVAAIPPPPVAKQVPVTDTYFGTAITDPYRWMEQPGSPELQTYLKAQDDRTRSILASIPGRGALYSRVLALSNTVTSSSQVTRRRGAFFYEKIAPGSNIAKVYVRSGIGGAERAIVDPEALTRTGPHQAISYWLPSDDGSLVAAGLSVAGSENATLHVFETATGHELADAIDRTDFGVTSWRHDNKALYYMRRQFIAPGAPPTAKYQNIKTYLHVLGNDPAKDRPVWGIGLDPNVKLDPNDFAFAFVTPSSPFAFGIVVQGVRQEFSAYTTPKAQLDGGKAHWKKVIDFSDDITNFALHGSDIYLMSHHNAPRFKVISVKAAHPDIANARTVIPAGTRVVRGIASARDALYVQSLEDGLGRMTRVPWTGVAGDVALPVNGTVSDLATEVDQPGFIAKLESWTVSPLWYAYDPATKRLTDTKLDPPSTEDYSGIVADEVKVPARDGVMVPLSIVHRKDMPMDGSAPTILGAYGSYGITQSPSFGAARLAWFEQGGALAIAHVRGGGEYGEEWHLAGKDANKPRTITDFIDCGQWLVDHKYTSPGKLGGRGGSAGGITMGGAITQAPQLFAAILDEIPLSDALRFEFSANGPPNVPEFGSVKTEAGYKNLYAISAIHHVRAGGMYPAVMLTTGAQDPRVDPWQAAKMTATLQADSASGKPILLRVDYEGGHGLIGATKEQAAQLATDEYAFMLWNMGAAGFQPSI